MAQGREDHALLFALCHEMGNLVGAIRLQTHLLDQEMSPRDLVAARSEIDVLGARVSALLTLVRPVEAGAASAPGEGIDPNDALAVVEHGLETFMLPGVRIELVRGGPGRRLRVDRNAVQALITSFVHLAIEQVRPSGRVRVGIEHRAGRGAFVIEDDGPADPGLVGWRDEPLRGRTLLCAIASHVAESVGGEVHAETAASGSRVELWLPFAEAG